MPKNFQTTGDPAHDFELDELWKQLRLLAAGQQAAIVPAAAAQPQQSVAAGLVTVSPVGSDTPTVYAQAIQFDASGDLLVTDAAPTAQIGRQPCSVTPAALAIAASAGSSSHAANADHTHSTPLAANGDLLTVVSGALARLAVGSTGEVLTVQSGQPAWAAPAGSSSIPVPALSIPAATWSTPAGVTEFVDSRYRVQSDLTNAGQARISVAMPSGILPSGLLLAAQCYSGGAWSYLDGASGPSVNPVSASVAVSSWVSLAASAKADLPLRMVSSSGGGSTVSYGSIVLEVK
ncbi:MAG TPA: hypothetical protein VGS41_09040 [Chthonomonadales bacterium]|nr:hypothetical protein [Chthonomonadales bacterium]